MLMIEGYCLKYGELGYPMDIVRRPALMRDPETNRICDAISNIPVYSGEYKVNYAELNVIGRAVLYLREDGIRAAVIISDHHMIRNPEPLKTAKLGCFATNIIRNKEGDVVDGYLRYVNINWDTNVHPVDKITINLPFKDPEVIFERSPEDGR